MQVWLVRWLTTLIAILTVVAFTPLAHPVAAQSQPALEAPIAAPALPTDTKAVRARLDGFKADLDQREKSLERDLSDLELQRLRQQIDPIAEAIATIVADLAPRLDATRARFEQLGPKPKDGQPAEGADAARERAEREAAVAELDETQRLGRALLVQAEQIRIRIGDQRRAGFTRDLFQETPSVLSAGFWVDVGQALPREWHALGTISRDALGHLRRNATWPALLLLGLAVGGAIALPLGRRHFAPRLVMRDSGVAEPSRRSRLLAGLAVLVLGTAPALAGGLIVWLALDAVDLLPPRLETVVAAILFGIAFVATVQALADAILAPRHGSWRLVTTGDAAAEHLSTFAVALAVIIAVGKTIETLNQAIVAAWPITVATRTIFALAAAAALAGLLRRFARPDEEGDEERESARPRPAGFLAPVRALGWIVVAVIGGAALAGYVPLASFVVDQMAWIALLLALLLLGLALADEFIGRSLAGQTRVASTLQANTGLRRRSLQQIGVLANGFARVALILVALMLALAPWGVDSSDLLPSLRAAFFGFRIGEVTISLSSIALACLLFVIGFAATRVVQGWLDSSFLPATDLDAGLRNSIRTGFGYLGIIGAALIAFSYLGVSLDRVAIIAGALSVGIGFGLQSIVNNFVSGLILLWERPIRVGDLVVVGDGEGYVRNISVRATEIETFDRSTILVPNSNLISGVVRNRVRKSRTGRVIVSVPAPRYSDPDQVAEILRGCALAHREVMSEPAPLVLFKKITDPSLDFDLVCFVDEVDAAARVSSELHFAVYRALRQAGIIQPPPAPTLTVGGLEGVGDSLKGIAAAIDRDRENLAVQAEPEAAPQELLRPIRKRQSGA